MNTPLVECMRENVAAAREKYERAIATYRRAREDGSIIVDVDTGCTRGIDAKSTETLGYARIARAEVDHWHGYLTWALQGGDVRVVAPAPRTPVDPEIRRRVAAELAEHEARRQALMAPDPRLPPERDEDEAVPL